MNKGIDISIEKLSAPVEALNIDRRICRALQRAGMYSVAEVVLIGKPKLRAAKRVGALTTRRVFEAVSGYLGLAQEQLAEASESLPGTCWDPWAAPTSILRLPDSILRELKHQGYCQVSQLIKARTIGYSSALWLNAKDIDEVDQALNDYLGRAAQGRLLTYVGMESILEPPSIPSPVLILPLPRLREGIWSALEWRTLQLLSLEEIRVRTGGTNRQQLHRGIQEAQEHVQQNLNILSIFLDYFEEKSNRLQQNLGTHPLEFETLIEHLLPDPAASKIILHEKEVERMIILIRSLVLHPRPWFREKVEAKWPTFILLSCLVDPALAQHQQVRQILEERKSRQKKQTTKETVYSVLAHARKPMCWAEIAEQACHLNDRTTVSAATVHNILIWHKELFARVGPGTYALVEWGNRTVETYPAIIASVLRQENRPLPFDLIFERVSAIRPVKRSSLEMNLDCHPRFYQSIQKTFGLRGWLAQGETQGLPIPDWLREDPVSLKRVERARAKGRHVEKIIAEDRLCPPVPASVS